LNNRNDEHGRFLNHTTRMVYESVLLF
jgi:hypothetical protein